MLLYVEDQTRAKEPQAFDRFQSAVVEAAAESAYVAAENVEEPGHTVCVGASRNFSVRRLAHCTLHIVSSSEAVFKQWRDVFSLTYYCGMKAVKGIKNLESRSKEDEKTRDGFKKLEGLHVPSSLQKVCAHMYMLNDTIHSAQAYIDMLITE